jgi:hypothetical protein
MYNVFIPNNKNVIRNQQFSNGIKRNGYII